MECQIQKQPLLLLIRFGLAFELLLLPIQKQPLLLLIQTILYKVRGIKCIQKQPLLLLIEFAEVWILIIMHSKTTFVTVNLARTGQQLYLGKFKNNLCYC